MSNNTILTPYAAAKLVNAARAEAGIEGNIPPQMMYNYTAARVAQGKAPFIAWTPESGVDRDDLERWTKAYIAKKLGTATPADPDQLELEFDTK